MIVLSGFLKNKQIFFYSVEMLCTNLAFKKIWTKEPFLPNIIGEGFELG